MAKHLHTLRDYGFQIRILYPVNFPSLQKDKTRYSMRKPDLSNTQLQTQSYTKYYKKNSIQKKLATSTKTQTIDDLIAANLKEGKTYTITLPTMRTKITGASNHWSLISLNINGFNSPIKSHRLTDWIQKQNPSFFYTQET